VLEPLALLIVSFLQIISGHTYPKEYKSNDRGIVVTELRVSFYAIEEFILAQKHSLLLLL
jgi:hypothetical protein